MKKKRAGTHKRKLIDTPFTKYIFRISLFRKYIHSDIMLSMMKYSLVKSMNRLKLFKK